MKTQIALAFTFALSISSWTSWASGASEAAASEKNWVLDIDKSVGAVTFDAIGRPSALKIRGKGEAPKGELKITKGKLGGACTFKLDTLDTGIALRNDHMKKRYLETEKHPLAKITFNELELPADYADAAFKAENLPFKGSLLLHGEEKPIEGTANVKRKGEAMTVDARFEFKISDYKIAKPSFAGVNMAEEVKVQVELTAPFRAQ